MRNFKYTLIVLSSVLLMACSDDGHFFTSLEEQSDGIHYSNVHEMTLDVTALNKVLDESGFAPVLKCELLIENLQQGPWPQAWVAFNIDIYIKGQKLATLTKAGALESHQLMVFFDQNLPKFGFTIDDIKIDIEPISWMPTYPLSISVMDDDALTNDEAAPTKTQTITLLN